MASIQTEGKTEVKYIDQGKYGTTKVIIIINKGFSNGGSFCILLLLFFI